MTFRMRGHEEASGVKYVPPALLEDWAKKDPVTNYELWLRGQNILSEEDTGHIREEIRQYIEAELGKADGPVIIVPDTAAELADIYAPAPVVDDGEVFILNTLLADSAGREDAGASDARSASAVF